MVPETGVPSTAKEMSVTLNRRFSTNVDLRNTTIDRADLPNASYDRAFSISVIEHLPVEQLAEVMHHVHRSLKPGGWFILTVDLFLNLVPFSSRRANDHGQNQNVKALAEIGSWELIAGDRRYLYGFPEFHSDAILSTLENHYIGQYPALAQCLILRKI
jgi:SAM-dependent methyltransferase